MLVWVVLGAALIVGFAILQYNRLVGMRQLMRGAWSDVDVYLKRRAELVPNLVAAVKGYAQHEVSTLESVVQARERALHESRVSGRSDAEAEVGRGVQQLLVLAESYPDLKASTSFLDLQRQLGETEKLIASARQYFNACVRDYNTMIEGFPGNLFASPLGFKPAEYFQLESASEREAPSVGGVG